MAARIVVGVDGCSMKALIVNKHIGRYHHVKFDAAARWGELVVVDINEADGMAFDLASGPAAYRRVETSPGPRCSHVIDMLDRERPDVLFCMGWAEPFALASLRWAAAHHTAVVMMSDSHSVGIARHALKEAVKAQILNLCGAALVAGKRQRDYIARLGMPSELAFTGYNVVDNAHFAAGADLARHAPDPWRHKLGLPRRYLLACQRLVWEKNTLGLVRAFHHTCAACPHDDHALVIVGDGPERPDVEALIAQLGLTGRVLLLGRRDYDVLPKLFGLATALVLPSVSETWGMVVNEAMAAGLPLIVSDACGCSDDLCVDGLNGLTVPAGDEPRLAEAMSQVIRGEVDLSTMGVASRAIIRSWDADHFARNFWAAAKAALARRRGRHWFGQLVVELLVRRAG